MKVAAAMDSFKGSLTSREAGEIVRKAVQDAVPCADVTVCPIADGGEGTVDAFFYAKKREGKEVSREKITVTGPLGRPVTAEYGFVEEEKLAVIEMAQAAGLPLVLQEERNPENTTSFGVGEIILAALDKGCRKVILGLGGSATNDGGMGMLQALGVRFLDESGKECGMFGKDMLRMASIDKSGMDPRLSDVSFLAACDVNNPLCGENGSSAVFGPQKGADAPMIKRMDEGLFRFAALAEKETGRKYSQLPGSGAAGGLGFAIFAFLHGEMESGIRLLTKMGGLEELFREADWVVTGEGSLDVQTSMGKGPAGIAELAEKCGCPTLAFTGNSRDCGEAARDLFDGIFSIVPGPCTLQEAMEKETARQNLYRSVYQVFRLLHRCWAYGSDAGIE